MAEYSGYSNPSNSEGWLPLVSESVSGVAVSTDGVLSSGSDAAGSCVGGSDAVSSVGSGSGVMSSIDASVYCVRRLPFALNDLTDMNSLASISTGGRMPSASPNVRSRRVS